MKTIREGWISYRDAAIPPHAGEAQRRDTKIAFYAGALHIFSLLTSGMITETSDEEGVATIDKLAKELDAFQEGGFK